MKVATMTKTMTSTGTISRVGALSTSCLSFLAAVWPKLQQERVGKNHGIFPHLHGVIPQSAGACMMLVEHDISEVRHDMLP